MQIKINGKSEEIQAATVLDVLKVKNIEPRMVAVELNESMVDRESLDTTPIREGDHLEFLFYMGGGR
ncbi:MAG TPA: sulfur carrier protein ThiS [Nitrospiraceae bacterium]|nr:sulfur carrier protein ThiS [Nitrospiraceae bacterium]